MTHTPVRRVVSKHHSALVSTDTSSTVLGVQRHHNAFMPNGTSTPSPSKACVSRHHLPHFSKVPNGTTALAGCLHSVQRHFRPFMCPMTLCTLQCPQTRFHRDQSLFLIRVSTDTHPFRVSTHFSLQSFNGILPFVLFVAQTPSGVSLYLPSVALSP